MIKKAAAVLLALQLLSASGTVFAMGLETYASGGLDGVIVIDCTETARSENTSVGEILGGTALLTGDEGSAGWRFTAPGDTDYTIYIQYCPLEGRGVDIERRIFLNGKNLFE